MQTLAVFCMCVHNVILQRVDRLNRVVARDHDKVCRIQVDGNALGMEAVKESLQRRCNLRAGLHGEVCLHGVCIRRKLAASILHDCIARVARVVRYNADMRCDHIGLEVLCKVYDAFGFFNELRVQLRVVEAVAEVAAQRRDRQAVILHALQKFAACFCVHILGRHFASCCVNLNAGRADCNSFIESRERIGAEAVHQNADRKGIHKQFPFLMHRELSPT